MSGGINLEVIFDCISFFEDFGGGLVMVDIGYVGINKYFVDYIFGIF